MIRHDSTVLLYLPVTPDSSPFKNDSAADLLRCPGSRLAQAGLSGPRRPFLSPSGICLFPDGYSSQPQPLSCFFSCCIMVAFSDAKDKSENANPRRICTFRCVFFHISGQKGQRGLIFRKKAAPLQGLPASMCCLSGFKASRAWLRGCAVPAGPHSWSQPRPLSR